MPDRRSFLATVGAGALAALGVEAATAGCGSRASRADAERAESGGGGNVGPVGVQLYTLQRQMREDVAATLARVARIGYAEVEFAGYFGRTANEVRALLDANGLRAPSGHLQADPFGDGRDAALEYSAAVGHEYVVIPWLDAERRRTVDDLRRFAGLLNRTGEAARRAGLRLAYHNHDFEFVPVEGRLPYDVLVAETDPALVGLELDIYWATKGGQDPLAWFARQPGRFPLLHLKDSSGPPLHRMTPVGSGTIDFRRLLARREQAGVRHVFVEHDEPADPWKSVEASYRYLAGLDEWRPPRG